MFLNITRKSNPAVVQISPVLTNTELYIAMPPVLNPSSVMWLIYCTQEFLVTDLINNRH